MNNDNFEFAFSVNKPAAEVFKAINNVPAWWNREMKGDSTHLNDEFSVQFWDVHYSKQKLVEFVPDEKVTWLVTKSDLNFLSDKGEWTGTKIIFELTGKADGTQVRFTHEGLQPKVECYDACSNAWIEYLRDSLMKYITTGQGQPYMEAAKTNA